MSLHSWVKFVALMDLNTLIVNKNIFTSFTCCHSVLEGWADVESTLGMWLAAVLFSDEELQITGNRIYKISWSKWKAKDQGS